jgi:transcriptional regulator with XRE-family HTH domain
MASPINQHKYKQEPATLADFLVQAMQTRNLSITALARSCGLTPQTLHSYLNGTRPNLESCRKLAFFLGEPVSVLIALAHKKDVEGKRLQSLIETYLELPDVQRQTAEDMMQILLREARRTNNGL